MNNQRRKEIRFLIGRAEFIKESLEEMETAIDSFDDIINSLSEISGQ